MKQVLKRVSIFVILLFLFSGSSTVCAQKHKEGDFRIKAINVGYGSSYLIVNHGVVTLVDTGTNAKFSVVRSALKKEKVKKIQNLVLTHPHNDHIGCAEQIIKCYKVNNIYMTQYNGSSPVYLKLMKFLSLRNKKVQYLYNGKRINIGKKASCIVCSPEKNEIYSNANSASIVMKIQYGKNRFMLMGDAPKMIEKNVMSSNDVKCDVVFIGHHGSNDSASADFLKACSPEYCLVSVGKNVIGAPMENALTRMATYSKNVLRTDYNGTIDISSNGKSIKVKKSKKGPMMNETSLELACGQNYKLCVNNFKDKLSWSSTNSEVASVDLDGTIQALHSGITRIFAKSEYAVFMCTVKVK